MRTPVLIAALLAAYAARAEASPPAAAAPAAEAKPAPEPSAWELDLFAGYGQLAYPALDMANVTWSNGGPGFALTVAYRGPHFTHPFLDLSYVPIISSGQYVNVSGPGGTPTTTFASNSSYALGFLVGPGWDVDWFRLRVGVGMYSTHVSTTVEGVTNSVSQVGLGFTGHAAAFLWRPEPFALGVEGRVVAFQVPFGGIYQVTWQVGLTGRWDFARHP